MGAGEYAAPLVVTPAASCPGAVDAAPVVTAAAADALTVAWAAPADNGEPITAYKCEWHGRGEKAES